jgi:general stress protein 26
MFTTIDAQGQMHSRPMDTQAQEFDGDLWFFSEASSRKVADLRANNQLHISYQSGNSFVSLSGSALITDNVAKKRELWKPDLEAWFENGPEDPNVLLIKFRAKSAEYWEGPRGGKLGSAIAAITVLLTGNEEAFGDNERVALD